MDNQQRGVVMTDEQKRHTGSWTATLRTAVAMEAADGVAIVFGMLVWQDGESITVRAQTFLEEFAPSYFAEEGLGMETLEDRLRMDMFGASMIPYLESKNAEIELSVEHDIATWIEANAPAMVSANLRIMEEALGQKGREAHRDLIKLHQLIDLEVYEAVQQRIIEKVWSDIETTLADVMAASAR